MTDESVIDEKPESYRVTADELRQFIERFERLEAEKRDIADQQKDPVALCEMCTDLDDLAEEVYVTVIHEIAHAAGIDDDRLHELGWA